MEGFVREEELEKLLLTVGTSIVAAVAVRIHIAVAKHFAPAVAIVAVVVAAAALVDDQRWR